MNKITYLFGSLSLLILIFLFTDPDEVSLAFVLVPFVLIGVAVYSLASLLLFIRIKPSGFLGRLISLSLSFLVVSLMLLASLGQLTLRDGLLVVCFTVLFLVYVGRADFLK